MSGPARAFLRKHSPIKEDEGARRRLYRYAATSVNSIRTICNRVMSGAWSRGPLTQNELASCGGLFTARISSAERGTATDLPQTLPHLFLAGQ